jgi:hypothetical protein
MPRDDLDDEYRGRPRRRRAEWKRRLMSLLVGVGEGIILTLLAALIALLLVLID